MKKSFVLSVVIAFLLSIPAMAGVPVDETSFPDAEFRALVSSQFDIDGDDFLLPDEFLAVTKIDCWNSIRDLTGIEYFEELTELNCQGCKLNKLDISQNTKLNSLDCTGTGLTSLDISSNPELHRLYAFENSLSTLNLSKNYYLSKAVKNGISNGKEIPSKYLDEETESCVIVDSTTTLILADETITPTAVVATPTPAPSSDSGMGGFASPEKGATYNIGSSVPVDIRPFGSVSIGGISVSGSCVIKCGSEIKLSKSVSGSKSIKFEYFPDSAGTYEITVNLVYRLSGRQVDTSRHTRRFTVVDPSAVPTATPVPTAKPEPTATPVPTAKPEPTATPVPTATPKLIATPIPTAAPTRSSSDISPENPTPAAQMESGIITAKSDADQAGSTFSLLQAKGTPKSNTAISLTWKKVPGATAYIIYGNKCGKTNRMKKIKTTKKLSFTVSKLKKGTYYKYLIVAVRDNDALAISKTIHVATNGGKVGNNTTVTLSRKSLSLKVGKSKKITAKLKGSKVKTHRKIAWESSNVSVAKVSKAGKITAVGKGTCIVYAYAQNGVCKGIKVKVS